MPDSHAVELVNYKSRMTSFMPGQRSADKERAFFVIFSTMIGAIQIARLLPDPAMREKVLGEREGVSVAELLNDRNARGVPSHALLNRVAR